MKSNIPRCRVQQLILFVLMAVACSSSLAQVRRVICEAETVAVELARPLREGERLVERRPHVPVGGQISESEVAERPALGEPLSNQTVVKYPRITDGFDRLMSRWVVIGPSREMIGDEIWSRGDVSASKFPSLPTATSKSRKGLGGIALDLSLLPDLVDLGIGHVTLNVSARQFFADRKPGAAKDAVVHHQYAGRNYVYCQSTVDAFQNAIDFFTEHNIVVSFIILINRADHTSDYGRLFVHPNCVDGNYSLANVTTEDSARHYAAFLNFLATRFSGPQHSARRGAAANWIIGNEVDAGWVWTNAGEMPVGRYVEQYARVMRVSQAAVQAVDPHARVFASLTHHWMQPHQPNNKRFYRGRVILERLARDSKQHGDYPWGVAYHPYPQSLFDPRTWDDKLATNDLNTPLITFKNLQVLKRFLDQNELLYEKLGSVLSVCWSKRIRKARRVTSPGFVVHAAAA